MWNQVFGFLFLTGREDLIMVSLNKKTEPVAIDSKKRLMNRSQVASMMGISVRTLTRIRNDPDSGFPKPVDIAAQARWTVDQVERFLARKEKLAEARTV